MVDKVTQANKNIAKASSKLAAGPVGAKMMEMMDVPSFARGLTPSMLIDLAKSKGIITREQQADFTRRVGKDRTALQEFNKIVTEADEPRLAYKGQSPAQIELLRAKGLMPATSINKTQRITLLKDTHALLNEVAAMDAPKEVKEKTFLEGMRKKFGDFADNPIVRKIASRALMILGAFPTALDFIPMSLLEEGMDMMDAKPEMAAKGGMINMNEMIRPVGFANGGDTIIPKEKPSPDIKPKEKPVNFKAIMAEFDTPENRAGPGEPVGIEKIIADVFPVDPRSTMEDRIKAMLGMGGGGGSILDDAMDIKTLGMIAELQGVLSFDEIDKMKNMSPIEIEILYNNTFGEEK